MPAVCRFYLKGNCRYGSSCRFEHPGEQQGSSGGFSFARALEDTPVTSVNTGFSFTKALHDPNPQSPYQGGFNQQPFGSFNQTFGSPVQQTPNRGFNFSSALTTNPTPFGQPTFGSPPTFGTFGQLSPIQQSQQSTNNLFSSTFSPHQAQNQQSFNTTADTGLRGDFPCDNSKTSQQTYDLTELELKAYNSDKFQFRLIPIRPPPESLVS